MRYRNLVLAPGSSKNGMELLRDFLGREPNSHAFFAKFGLNIEQTKPSRANKRSRFFAENPYPLASENEHDKSDAALVVHVN